MRAWLALALVFSGCDAAVDERYRGVPTLTLEGEVVGDPAPFIPYAGRVRLSLFYFPQGPRNGVPIDALEEDEATSVVLSPPSSVRWVIYDRPEPRHLATTPSGKRYGVAVAYAYLDEDGDGRHDDGERMVGEAPIATVLHAPEPLTAEESPTGRPLHAPEPAYAIRPLWCRPRLSEPEARQDCGVPIGAPCETDAACGPSGRCLTTSPFPWPDGACALPASSTCTPADAHLFRNHRQPTEVWWLKACAADADCRQPYLCDVANGVCLPYGNLSVRLGLPMALPVCQP